MPIRLSHIAIAAPKIQAVLEQFQKLSFQVAEEHDVPSEKVRAVMLPMAVSPELRLELLEPTSADSPISKFLDKRGRGIHHISFEVTQIENWEKTLRAAGLEILPPGIRKAARGRALFIHPKSLGGVLVELEEIQP